MKPCRRRKQDTMWPILSLTLLLQLTDDEQLYAVQDPMPANVPAAEAPVPSEQETPAADVPCEAPAEA